jgi:Putative DnaT-like ssDNA binding protein
VSDHGPHAGVLALVPTLTDIDALPASPTANSYVSVEEATLLLQDHLHIEAWYTPDPENAVTLSHLREAALIQATRLIDAGVWWHGMPTTATQALAWPQTGQLDHFGRPLATDTIPRVIKQATAFYALALLDEGAAGGGSGGSGFDANIKTKKIGDTSITYKDEVVAPVSVARTIPSEIRTMLHHYGIVAGSGIIPVLRT